MDIERAWKGEKNNCENFLNLPEKADDCNKGNGWKMEKEEPIKKRGERERERERWVERDRERGRECAKNEREKEEQETGSSLRLSTCTGAQWLRAQG